MGSSGEGLARRFDGAGTLKRNLLLSASVLVGTLASYGRGAQAQQVCEPRGGSSYLCSGTSTDTQTITRDNATVSTDAPLVINTTDSGGNAIVITGDGALSFTDPRL